MNAFKPLCKVLDGISYKWRFRTSDAGTENAFSRRPSAVYIPGVNCFPPSSRAPALTMDVSPEGMIALLWGFLAFDLVFLTIRLYLVITRPRVTRAAFASEVCICLAFTLFLFETTFTTVYQAALIKYRHDPTVNKSIGMPRSKLVLFFKVRLLTLLLDPPLF